ncbi:hypothetical protein CLV30_11897 [Haloactinopolyspora alba]|uniref:Uncharacterized protein n=1 Tax=Haloactinopolyspora alba TaxID=648780 RepID=A0A2P8DPP3_9ACTN|nr:hypothetical protein [Haloactinopolyspora alba]PSK99195.1 hypothetical protein CLV30_11897 [Haloactinopolyspora alba]
MSALLAVVVTMIVAIAVIALAGAARRTPPPAAGTPASEASRRVDAHLRRARLAGITLVIAAATSIAASSAALSRAEQGWPLFVAVPLAALLLPIAVAVGESTAPIRRTSVVRTATLRPRDSATYLPAWRLSLMRASAGTAAIAMIIGIVTATDGRRLVYSCADLSTSFAGGASSPYPGAVYAVPGVLALTAVVLVAELTVRRIVGRPPAGDPELDPDAELDERLRCTALRSVARAASTAAAVLLVQTSLPMAWQLNRAADALADAGCGDGSIAAWWDVPAYAGAALGLSILAALAVDVYAGRPARVRTRSGARS